MRFVVLTNFDDYNSNISCDKYGVITLKLVPNNIKKTRFKDNYFKKERATYFKSMYCTCYKKSKNEYLYKYTNHKPNNNFEYEVLKILEHNIPINYNLKWINKEFSFKKLKSNFYHKRFEYYLNKYNSL